ncbi:MAG: IclR family transcriptional regulator [Qingshengfaniella sp.]
MDEGADDLRGRDDVDPRYVVPGLARGLFLLQVFNGQQSDLTLAELAEAAGLSRSSTYRLVYTLEKEGFLSRDPETRRYALTSRVMTLGFAFLAARPLIEIVHPFLRRISQATGLAAHLVELDGTETVYLARVAPSVRVISNLQIGMRLPAHSTVSGRVLLADMGDEAVTGLYPRMLSDHPDQPPPPLDALLDRAHEDAARGHVMGESAFDPGIASFAAPVRNGAGQVVAALNVIGPVPQMLMVGSETELQAIVGAEAQNLSVQLGWREGP